MHACMAGVGSLHNAHFYLRRVRAARLLGLKSEAVARSHMHRRELEMLAVGLAGLHSVLVAASPSDPRCSLGAASLVWPDLVSV